MSLSSWWPVRDFWAKWSLVVLAPSCHIPMLKLWKVWILISKSKMLHKQWIVMILISKPSRHNNSSKRIQHKFSMHCRMHCRITGPFLYKVLRLYQVKQFYTILAAKNLQTFKLLFSMWAWSNIYLFGCWCEFIIALICNNINFSIQ